MNNSLEKLLEILKEGKQIGLDLDSFIAKLESIIANAKDGIIKIVLLGSTSDGKTTTIAGLLGRLEKNMKIDVDESSDELTIYRPEGLKQGYEIVDTPGLFGTKEKEVDGRTVRFSEITEKYISEAHILIYVCDAVNTLKDSHVPILSKILRDYKKLDSTIFVLNKMDEAGYDLTDNDDFKRGSDIKKQALICRLRDTMNITPDEEIKLNIVCIAADPKGKGLEHWFAKPEDYKSRSHISELKDAMDNVVSNSNADDLRANTQDVSIKDVIKSTSEQIVATTEPITSAIAKFDKQLPELRQDLDIAGRDVKKCRVEMKERIKSLKNSVLADINGASMDTIGDVINEKLGVQNNDVTFYEFNSSLNTIIIDSVESNNSSLQNASVKIERSLKEQDEMMIGLLKRGAEALKGVKIDANAVKNIRDVVANGHKFKPWGAVKLGEKATKWLGGVAVGISVAIEAWEIWKKIRDAKKLQKMKDELSNAVNEIVSKLYSTIDNDGQFYENFAPAYLAMEEQLKLREQDNEKLRKKIEELEQFRKKMLGWNDAEDVQYQEV